MNAELKNPENLEVTDIGHDTPIMDMYSPDEVDMLLSRVTSRFRTSWPVTMNSILKSMQTSPYLLSITGGTVWWLIDFLWGFHSRSQCAFYHERVIRIVWNWEVLTPETCARKDAYAWCGHPELNWLLIAIALAEDIVWITGDHIWLPPYVVIRQLDAQANTRYYNTELWREDIGYVRSELIQSQKIFGEKIMQYTQQLSKMLSQKIQ